jgi:hypothetical protein
MVGEAYEPIGGPYHLPRCRVGGKLFCELRGWVTVGGMTAAPVPWPYAKARGAHSLILTRDLVAAVRTEAEIVVCHLFGVSSNTVWKWRKALGVPHATPGTSELKAASKRGVRRQTGRVRAWTAYTDDLVRTLPPKAAAKRLRRSMAAVYARRQLLGVGIVRAGRRVTRSDVWTAAEDEAVLSMKPKDAAKRLGRSLMAVYIRRNRLRS